MKTGRSLQDLAAEIERQNETKKDFIASTTQMSIEPIDGKFNLIVGDKDPFPIKDIAHDQIAEHTKIPRAYYNRMKTEAPGLLATNVDTWFEKNPTKRMVRTLDGGARAFLSDKFAPLDNFDFAQATLPILAERKLKVQSCEITDKRLYIKAVDEQLFKDVPVGHKMGDGSHRIFDTCAPAIILSNSEVGFGRLLVETGIYTSACTNLALFAKGGMKRTHVGARHMLTDGMDVADLEEIMSHHTKRKTMEALWLQVRDVLKSAFDEKVVGKRLEELAEAAGRKIEGRVDKVMEVVQEKFGLNDDEGGSVLRHLIEGGRLDQLGLSNAITRAAQDVESYDRATELEYAGGAVIELPRTEWARLAEAA
jgi:hypothetical protein